MKLLVVLPLVVMLTGCSLNAKNCDPKKSVSVFQSKALEVNEIIELNNVKNVIFKSYREPELIRYSTNNKILIEGSENMSVAGYHTDQCTAEEMKKRLVNAKPTVGYEREKKGNTLIIKTTGEIRYIHHQNAFSTIKIRLPKNIIFKYKHSPLKNG